MCRHDGTAPLMIESGLYTRQQVMRLLNVSSETLGHWKAEGLRSCRRGTKQAYYVGRDLIRFLQGGEVADAEEDDGGSDGADAEE